MKTVYVNGILLDGTKEMQPVTGKAILVDGKRIVGIADENDRQSFADYEQIDLHGACIMPGLINLHVHLAGSGKPKKKATDPKKAVKLITGSALMRAVGKRMVAAYAKTELFSGTTTIRTVGGISDFDTTIRDEIRAGKRVGPRILAGNMAISVPGGHMAGSLGYEANSAEEAKNLVDLIAEDSPDLIKLMITGGVMDAEVVGEPGVLRMPAKYVKAACDRAHELGFMVAAHVESPAGVRVALENGVDSIEHGARPEKSTMELFQKTKAFHVSTISPALPYALFDRSISGATYEQQENGKIVFDGIIEMARACLAAGVPVGLGTDTACPYITHYDMWRELYYFVKYCHVTNAFALHSATLQNAVLAGVGDLTGSIEVGKMADMIVTEKNPLEDIKALRNVKLVVMEGALFKNPKVKKFEEVERELDKF